MRNALITDESSPTPPALPNPIRFAGDAGRMNYVHTRRQSITTWRVPTPLDERTSPLVTSYRRKHTQMFTFSFMGCHPISGSGSSSGVSLEDRGVTLSQWQHHTLLQGDSARGSADSTFQLAEGASIVAKCLIVVVANRTVGLLGVDQVQDRVRAQRVALLHLLQQRL